MEKKVVRLSKPAKLDVGAVEAGYIKIVTDFPEFIPSYAVIHYSNPDEETAKNICGIKYQLNDKAISVTWLSVKDNRLINGEWRIAYMSENDEKVFEYSGVA